mmetsp:Transcript_86623/g.245108  ORF Transcript_86623/g.245108 Transcript_86623/m.245108 type:complete len:372 (-) Transcript_86623:1754-2869(-)
MVSCCRIPSSCSVTSRSSISRWLCSCASPLLSASTLASSARNASLEAPCLPSSPSLTSLSSFLIRVSTRESRPRSVVERAASKSLVLASLWRLGGAKNFRSMVCFSALSASSASLAALASCNAFSCRSSSAAASAAASASSPAPFGASSATAATPRNTTSERSFSFSGPFVELTPDFGYDSLSSSRLALSSATFMFSMAATTRSSSSTSAMPLIASRVPPRCLSSTLISIMVMVSVVPVKPTSRTFWTSSSVSRIKPWPQMLSHSDAMILWPEPLERIELLPTLSHAEVCASMEPAHASSCDHSRIGTASAQFGSPFERAHASARFFALLYACIDIPGLSSCSSVTPMKSSGKSAPCSNHDTNLGRHVSKR